MITTTCRILWIPVGRGGAEAGAGVAAAEEDDRKGEREEQTYDVGSPWQPTTPIRRRRPGVADTLPVRRWSGRLPRCDRVAGCRRTRGSRRSLSRTTPPTGRLTRRGRRPPRVTLTARRSCPAAWRDECGRCTRPFRPRRRSAESRRWRSTRRCQPGAPACGVKNNVVRHRTEREGHGVARVHGDCARRERQGRGRLDRVVGRRRGDVSAAAGRNRSGGE